MKILNDTTHGEEKTEWVYHYNLPKCKENKWLRETGDTRKENSCLLFKGSGERLSDHTEINAQARLSEERNRPSSQATDMEQDTAQYLQRKNGQGIQAAQYLREVPLTSLK